MIRLKTILLEYENTYTNPDTPITLGPTDEWQYYLDSKTNKWYTRKKDTTKWIDMEANLSVDNMRKALNRINQYLKERGKKPIEKIKTDDDAKLLHKLKKGDKVKFNPVTAKVGENLTVYKYNNTGFYKAGTYRVEQNPNVKYLGQDSSGEYALVKFPEGKYWIKKRFLL